MFHKRSTPTVTVELPARSFHRERRQMLTETGALGFLAVLGFPGVVYVRAFRKQRGPRWT